MTSKPQTTTQKEYNWYYSFDEERYQGPFNSLEEAVSEAAEENFDDADKVHVMEATKGEYRISFPDYWWEWVDDANSDLLDPDGDGLVARIGDDAAKELTDAINKVIDEWKKKTKLPEPWAFGKTRNGEWVALPKEEDKNDE